jgi:ribosomal protein S18 acetylase RimI-like enzyme
VEWLSQAHKPGALGAGSGAGKVISVQCRDAVPADLAVVAPWVGSRRECERWAGPRIPYPLQLSALAVQIEMAEAVNVVLEDEQGIAAFGQALARGPGRAHLGRIIVRPDARRRGLGRILIAALLARAEAAGRPLATLYVYRDNAAAIRLYTSLGFRRSARPPEDPPSSGVWFMQRVAGSENRGWSGS